MTSGTPDLFTDDAPVDEYQEGVRDQGAGICPRCRSVALGAPLGANAWSRTSRGEGDVPVYVCSPCGSDEADEDWQLPGGATPQSDWPVAPRDSSTPSRLDPELDELSRYMAAIRDLRNSGSGIWQMMGGKVPEPERSDPFKPEGEWVHLDDRLWTVTAADLRWWAGHAHPTVRRIVAAHETCPPELLDRLAEDPWVEIRQAALGNTALDPSTLTRVATQDPVEWLREAANEPEPRVHGRCGRCGRNVKRPDRFLTCSIACSVAQARERIDQGVYLRHVRVGWAAGYRWDVAVNRQSGGIRGSGPRFIWVWFSFVPGLGARECEEGLVAVGERQDLTGERARNVLDQLAQTMDGPSVLDACRELGVEADTSGSRQLLGTGVSPSTAPPTPSGRGGRSRT